MIEGTMGEVRSLMMFHQVDGEDLCDQGLEICEMDLWAWRLGSMAKPEGNR